MHLPKHSNIFQAGFSSTVPLPWTVLWITILIVFLANGCASNKDMEFHPKISAEKKKHIQTVGPIKSTHSKTNLSTATDLTINPSSCDTRFSVTNNNRIITLTDPWAGKVAFVNPAARFVILDYSLSQIPPVGQRMAVFRKGVRIGEVRITGQSQSGYVAADIATGEIQNGDETRRQ